MNPSAFSSYQKRRESDGVEEHGVKEGSEQQPFGSYTKNNHLINWNTEHIFPIMFLFIKNVFTLPYNANNFYEVTKLTVP